MGRNEGLGHVFLRAAPHILGTGLMAGDSACSVLNLQLLLGATQAGQM